MSLFRVNENKFIIDISDSSDATLPVELRAAMKFL